MTNNPSEPQSPIPKARDRPQDVSGRPSSTPLGFRNLRVLLPEELHWRLREMANQSRMTFQLFIVSWLAEAFPLNRPPELPVEKECQGAALACSSPVPSRSGPSSAPGQGAAQSQEALASSDPDRSADPAKVGQIVDRQLAVSFSGPETKLAEAEGHAHA